jgi:hypothetical protein
MKTMASETSSGDAAQSLTLESLRQACSAAEADLRAAEHRIRAANWKVRRLAFRYYAVRFGLPAWVVGLIVGSVASLIPSVALILTGRASPVSLLIFCIVGYALIGIGAYSVARDEPGEDEESRNSTRLQKLMAARQQREGELAARDAILDEVSARRRVLEQFIISSSEAMGGRLFTFVLVPHARQPWDEGSFWVVPGRCSVNTIDAIANGSPPEKAVRVLGPPARWAVVNEAAANLAKVMEAAGVRVIVETVADE